MTMTMTTDTGMSVSAPSEDFETMLAFAPPGAAVVRMPGWGIIETKVVPDRYVRTTYDESVSAYHHGHYIDFLFWWTRIDGKTNREVTDLENCAARAEAFYKLFGNLLLASHRQGSPVLDTVRVFV